MKYLYSRGLFQRALLFLCLFGLAPLLSLGSSQVIQGPWSLSYPATWSHNQALEPQEDGGPRNLSLPTVIDPNPSEGQTIAWVVLETNFDPEIQGGTIPYLLMEPLGGAVFVYLNGIPFYSNGSVVPRLFYFNSAWHGSVIPLGDLTTGEGYRLTIAIANDGSTFKMVPPQIGGADSSFETFNLRAFVNQELYLAFAFINLFIFGFFLLQFVNDPKNTAPLLLGLANLFFGLYFVRMANGISFLPMVPVYAISKGFLSLAFMFLFLFFLRLYPLKHGKLIGRIFTIVGISMALMISFLPKTNQGVEGLFLITLIPGQVIIFSILAMAFRALRRGDKNAWIVLFGTLWGVGLGTHDIVFMFSGLTPLFWLQGIGIFGFNLSMFAMEAVRQLHVGKMLESSEADGREKQRHLEATVLSVRQALGGLTDLSGTLDNAVQAAGKGLGDIGAESATIAKSIDDEYESSQEVLKAVQELDGAVQRIFVQVEGQTNHIKSTALALQEMMAAMSQTTASLGATATFTKELDAMVQAGQESVEQSELAMKRIDQESEGISSIVQTVTEIANQTNILSMNAAIEAAHAGDLGKGFAVLAEEIKRLAQDSGEKSREIAQGIRGINESIAQGNALTSQVATILEQIGADSSKAASQVAELYQVSQDQQRVSQGIRDNLEALRQASLDIQVQAEGQNRESAGLRQAMGTLVQSLASIRLSVGAIRQGLDNLTESAGQIQQMSSQSRLIGRDLSTILEKP